MKILLSHKSLRLRLQVGILLTLLVAWTALFFWYRADVMREQTGEWDTNLRNAAQMALLSLPRGLEQPALLERGYALPDQTHLERNSTHLGMQAWSLGDRRLLLRSPVAPPKPLVPGMRDGFDNSTIRGENWRVYALSDAEGRIQIQVGKPIAQLRQELGARLSSGLFIIGALFIMLAGVAWLVINGTLLPVLRVSDRINKRHALDLQPLPAADLPNEFHPLVNAFNRQLSRLDAAVQNERRFLVNAAHELRTPLAVVTMQTENALRCEDPAEVRQALLKLLAATQRGARLAEQLLDMARIDANASAMPEAKVDLWTVLQMVVRDFENMASERGQTLLLDAEPCTVRGHIDALGILVRNLLDNAVRYSGHGSRIEISCRHASTNNTQHAMLTVADDGPGVPDAERKRIFDRFYRIPGTGEHGSGIGLSLVEQIATLHEARVEAGAGLGGKGFGISLRFAAVLPG